MKNKIKRIILLFSVIIMITPFFVPVSAKSTSKEIIIAFADTSDSLYSKEDDIEEGYIPEFIEVIQGYIPNYKLKLVGLEWQDAIEKLKTGEIDFLFTGTKTTERLKTFSFSEFNTGIEKLYLYALKDYKIYYDDYEAIDGKKVGVFNQTAYRGFLENYQKENNIQVDVIEYSSDDELKNALEIGEVDFVASSNLFDYSDYRIVSIYGSSPFYAMTIKDNPKLDILNLALRKAYEENKVELDEIYNKYFEVGIKYEPSFTYEDVAYIEHAKKIKIGLYGNNFPLSGWIGESARGILVDILDMIAETSGLEFEYVELDSSLTTEQNIVLSNLDLAVSLTSSYQDWHMIHSKPILSSDYVVVSKKNRILNMDEKLNVAIPFHKNEINQSFDEDLSDMNFLTYNSTYDCLSELMKDRVEFALLNSFVFNYEFKNPYFNDIEVKTYYTQTLTADLVALKGNDTLINVINKTIPSVTEEDVKLFILTHNNHANTNITLLNYIYPYRLPLIVIGVLAILSLLLAILMSRNKKQQARNQIELRSIELANKTKSDFLSQMSHEIRTPMNAIVNLSQAAISEKDNPEELEECLEDIKKSSKYLVLLVNDILDMSKFESGMLTLKKVPTSLISVVNECEKILDLEIESKGINFRFKTNMSEDRLLLVDPLRFQQMIMNILSNAIKFSYENGDIDFILEETVISETKVQVELTIKDNGIGMSNEFLPKIFTPFCQENATQYGLTGTGLGLSIAKSLVDLNNGTIQVESKLGLGTTFIIQLEYGIASNKAFEKEIELAHTDEACFINSRRILLVEDNELNTKVAKRILETRNYLVDTATNGHEAVEMFTKSMEDYYDAIIMDIKMPVCDGLTATRLIRSLDRTDSKAIPIVAVSANIFDTDKCNSLAAGMNYYLTKPIDPDTLYDVLFSLISKYDVDRKKV
jgi:signal transduction histidine kinase/CheY-like chemotaxis protein